MPSGKSVIFALGWTWKSTQAVKFAVVVELVTSSSQYLVGIGLVSHVPYKPVVGCVKHIMQGHDDFYGSHARREVARITRQLMYHELPKLMAHLRQLVNAQFSQVGRAVDLSQ